MSLSGGACGSTRAYVKCRGTPGTTSPGGTFYSGYIQSGSAKATCGGTSLLKSYGYQDALGTHPVG